jgi:hypothetical protein
VRTTRNATRSATTGNATTGSATTATTGSAPPDGGEHADRKWGDAESDEEPDLNYIVALKIPGGAFIINPSRDPVYIMVSIGSSEDKTLRVQGGAMERVDGSRLSIGTKIIENRHILVADDQFVMYNAPVQDHPLRTKIITLLDQCRIRGMTCEYVLQDREGEVVDTNMEGL